MNYTEKEIEVIKQRALERGRREGVLLMTFIIAIFFIIVSL